MLASLFVLLSFGSAQAAAPSIRDLPHLAALLVDRYECRLALSLDQPDDFKETNFQFSALLAGQQSAETTLKIRNDEVVASTNSQTLQIKWTRAGKGVASSLTMIKKSTTEAYVLIVNDPTNESNRVDLSCSAITFADLKGQ